MTIIEKLCKIGFSENEALIYVELLKKSGLNGTQLSKILNLPRSSVYGALENLLKKNIVYIIPTNKDLKNYNPIYPEDLVKRIKNEYMYILENIGTDLDKIYTPAKYELVYNLEGKENIQYKLEDMLGNAKYNRYVSGYLNDNILEKYKLTKHTNKQDTTNLVCLIDNTDILVANITNSYANAIYTKNKLIIEQIMKGLEC